MARSNGSGVTPHRFGVDGVEGEGGGGDGREAGGGGEDAAADGGDERGGRRVQKDVGRVEAAAPPRTQRVVQPERELKYQIICNVVRDKISAQVVGG